ncbi:hypothetical protein [Leptospira sarikeiensis]|uniref:Lipoprotein n=1 Tax=Leptospira sarikeiensis TaxID=2484943 RepID=A0A4R9K4M4_9LEPT|nr:hypothetical protein [Leptospira sarikeiensis]TGL61076.1 hypothetical protein EHQ64_14895 [Leptospira sarikeiensis]
MKSFKIVLLFSILFLSSCRGFNLQNFRNFTFETGCDWFGIFCDKIVVNPDLSDCDPFHEEYEGYSHYIDRGILKNDYKIEEQVKQENEPEDPTEPLSKKKEKIKATNTDYGNNMRIDSKKLFERYDISAGRRSDKDRSKHPCSVLGEGNKPKVYYSEPKNTEKGGEF